LIGLGLSVLLCAAALGTFQASEVIPPVIPMDDLLGGLTVLALLALLGTLVAQWLVPVVGVTREVRTAYRRVSRAVNVRRYDPDVLGGGYVTFAFGNREFADRFQEMNGGVVSAGRVG